MCFGGGVSILLLLVLVLLLLMLWFPLLSVLVAELLPLVVGDHGLVV